MTPGFDVFVHEVIAAMTTDPWVKLNVYPLNYNFDVFLTSYGLIPNPLNPGSLVKHLFQSALSYFNGTKSWGLFGPATLGYTVDKSSYNTLV